MDDNRILVRPAPPFEQVALIADSRCAYTCRVPGADGGATRRHRPTAPVGAKVRSIAASAPTTPAEAENAMAARRFAIATLTQVLEVLDRRRAVRRLDPLVAGHLIDQITALVRAPEVRVSSSAPDNTATLRRLHVQMRDFDAAEIFGTYRRGERVRAFAGRIERRACRVRTAAPGTYRAAGVGRQIEYRWQLVAFRVA